MHGESGSQRSGRIEELLREALELEPQARTSFLEEACSDESVQREVERLLRAQDEIDEVGALEYELRRELIASEGLAGASADADDPGPSASGERFGPGDRIDHFVIREEIGRGGMGVVYRARDVRLEREVALKFLPRSLAGDPTSRRRFLQEARTASSLDHPNVGTVFEVGRTARGEAFLAMAYYRGPSLAEELRQGRLSIPLALEYATQIAGALSATHDRGIVHRDVKPSNVLLPENAPLKMVDFGLARWADDSGLTRTGKVLGTVSYMSPEQIRGERVDARSDLWALGVVLYEMIAGSRPFGGEYEAALSYQIVYERHDPLDEYRHELPSGLSDLVDRALRKDPGERPPTADAFLSELRNIARAIRTAGEEGHGSAGTSVRKGRTADGSSGFLSISRRTGSYSPTALAARAVLVTILAAGAWYLGLQSLAATANDARGTAPSMRLAVLPQSVSPAPRADPILPTLGAAITDLLGRIDEEVPAELTAIAPNELRTVAGAREARATFGVDYVLSLRHDAGANPPALTIALVDATELVEIRATTLALDGPTGDLDRGRLIEELGRLLELNLPPPVVRRLTWEAQITPGAREYYERGRANLASAESVEDLETASRFFRWAAEREPSFTEAHAELAMAQWQIFERTGRASAAELARAHEEIARETDSRRPTTHVQNGLLSVLTGDYRRAILEFKTAVSQDSTSTDAYRGLGRAYAGLGQNEDAGRAYRSALALRPDEWPSYEYLGSFYYRLGRCTEAAEVFESAIEADSTWGGAYLSLGAAHYCQNRRSDARRAFQRALSLEELDRANRYRAYSNLGTLHYYAERYGNARDAYRAALEIDSTSHRVWGNLGSALSAVGAPDPQIDRAYHAAARLADRALTVNPKQPELMCSLAEYRFELGQLDEARSLLRKAVEAAPDNVNVLFQSGHLMELLGERDRALELLSRAVSNGYPSSVIRDDPELEALRSDPRYSAIFGRSSPEPVDAFN